MLDFLPKIEGRVCLIAVSKNKKERWRAEDYLDELEELAKSVGCLPVYREIVIRKKIDSATFIGRGKAQEIGAKARCANCKAAIFDEELSPSQVRELEKLMGVRVIDRDMLILQIFQKHASSKEAKTQVELASLEYIIPRLARYWTHLSRQKGGIGLRGEGEKQIELDRRIVKRRISRLKRELDKIHSRRIVQRKSRSGRFVVALTGYTNVGKSQLFRMLTKAETQVKDKMFSTLDTKVRKSYLGEGCEVLVSDTVGFIRKLPHNLVASFRSTLSEIEHADLILHVVDISHPNWMEQKRLGEEILMDFGIKEGSILTVYNKIDKLKGELYNNSCNECYVSALLGTNLEELKGIIRKRALQHNCLVYKNEV